MDRVNGGQLVVMIASLAMGGCSWRDGEARVSLVLGVGVIRTHEACDGVVCASDLRATGVVALDTAAMSGFVIGCASSSRVGVRTDGDVLVNRTVDVDGRMRVCVRPVVVDSKGETE